MSEFSLIYQYFKSATSSHKNTVLGIGDDCAVSNIPEDCQLVSCVDTLVMGRHFPEGTQAYAIGYKSVAVNLSDLAAMGAVPYAILLGISLPDCDAVWLAEFSQGITDICAKFGVELIGGDTTKSDKLTISVTALGFVKAGTAITRDGAQIGDIVCVSGNIGSASYALDCLFHQQATTLQSALDLPNPQVELAQKLAPWVNSMIDISDGLGQDLGHILTVSKVGAMLFLDKIPCADELSLLSDDKRWQYQLNGGDDYELCFTLSPENFTLFSQKYPNSIFAIGKIIADKKLVFLNHQKPVNFCVKGYQHF